MQIIFDFLEEGDVCSLTVLIGLLIFIGAKMAGQNLRYMNWGLRAATAMFLICTVYGAVRFSATTPGALVSVLIRSLAAAALTVGTVWILLPAGSFLHRNTLGALIDRVRLRIEFRKLREFTRQRKTEEEVQRRRVQEEYERSAPQREQARREAQARAEVQAQAQHRRENARASCEFLFSLYSYEIRERFPKEVFEDFLTRYMGDNRSAEYVEQRGEQLRKILEQHHNCVAPQKSEMNFNTLSLWYADVKRQIEASDLPPEVKKVRAINLERRYDELLNSLIQEMSP